MGRWSGARGRGHETSAGTFCTCTIFLPNATPVDLFFCGQLPGLNFSISTLISIRSTPRNAMGKKSKQKAAQAHAAEQARLQQMSTGGQPSAASSQWDLRPLALKVCMCLMVFLLSFIFFPFFWPPPTAIWFRRCGTYVHGKYYYCKNQNKCHNQLLWLALQRRCLKTTVN